METKRTKWNTIVVMVMVVTLLVCLTACPNVNDGSPTTYTVTYDANGATGTVPTSQTKTHGTDLTLATKGNLEKTDYIFAGWNTKENGEGITYPAGGSYTENAQLTLYARWVVGFPNISITNSDSSISTYEKTSEVVVIAKDTTVTVHKTDDSSWSSYYSGTDDYDYKGVFIKDRSVTLSPFVMGQYEVTQELYEAVMEINPSDFQSGSATGETQKLRPVEMVTWYDAVAFCNKLTEQTMAADNCVYVIDEIERNENGSIIDATVTADYTKKGYRLPTEAEWEFAARGGKPNAPKWDYAYAGVQTEKAPSVFTSSPYNDAKLDNYAWYDSNSGDSDETNQKTHEVGKKNANALGLYDMSGNVWEWCYDWYSDISTGEFTNPVGDSSGSYRVYRGGSWYDYAYYSSVSCRNYDTPVQPNNFVGFRVCRLVE